jgi:hypothetical protein
MSGLTEWCRGIEEEENQDQSREESQSRAQSPQRASRASKSERKTPAASQTSPNRPPPAFRGSGNNPSSNRSTQPFCRPCHARSLRVRPCEWQRIQGSSHLWLCDGAWEYCRIQPCNTPSPKEKTQRLPSARTKTQSRANRPTRQRPSVDCNFCDSRSIQKACSIIPRPPSAEHQKMSVPCNFAEPAIHGLS